MCLPEANGFEKRVRIFVCALFCSNLCALRTPWTIGYLLAPVSAAASNRAVAITVSVEI